MKLKIKNFLYDLFISFLISLINNFFTKGISDDFTSFIVSLKQYKFYLFWLCLLIFILFLRFLVRKMIDKKQDSLDIYFIPRDYQGSFKYKHLNLNWEVFCDFELKTCFASEFRESRKIDLEKVRKIDVGFVEGPFCPNDKREMKVSRTYWGLFKYKCPKCKYKRIMTSNRITLENDVIDEVESKFR